MKKIFFIIVILLMAQSVFSQDYNRQFAEKFLANDISGIETLLKTYGHQMDLQVCLDSVSHSLAWITDMESTEILLNEDALPLNRNRNSIFRVLQLLVNTGVDLNTIYHEGLYTSSKSESGSIKYHYKNNYFCHILYHAIKKNSQPNMAIIRFLLESGAMPTSRNAYYMDKELFMAIDQGNVALVKLLIDAGWKVDDTFYSLSNFVLRRTIENSGDISALQYAAYLGEFSIVKTLVEAGAKINYTNGSSAYLASKTAAIIARDRKETDIFNYLQQNGAVVSQSSQVASTPPPSSQPRQTYNDNYDYSPPPSSSSSSSTPSRNLGKEIAEAFKSPLQSGTYSSVGTKNTLRLSAIAKSGMFSYNVQGQTGTGTYSIEGNRMTIKMLGYTLLYTVDSETSFSGGGETWVRTGY